MTHLEIELAGERAWLLGGKSLYLAEHESLLIADIHFGKAAAYRAQGQPVPSGTTQETLALLDRQIEYTRCRFLIFLGDFLHAQASKTDAVLLALRMWRLRHRDLICILVRGNHDLRAGDPPPDLGVAVVDEPYRLGPFALCHEPRADEHYYVLAGHIHPACVIRGRAHERLRLPCFCFNDRTGVLPAFGAFTGSWTISTNDYPRIYALAENKVWSIPNRFAET